MNIYIGNLSLRLKEDHIRELFEAFGEVIKVKLVKDHTTGISKGIAFIEMKYDAEGTMAIQQLNKCELDGNKMVVAKAKTTANVSQNKKGKR